MRPLYAAPALLQARGLSLRPEQTGDRPLLQDIYIRHRWNEFAFLPLPDAQKIALLTQQFAIQHQQYRASEHDTRFLVIIGPGGISGRFYFSERDRDFRLIDILLDLPFRRQGLGTALLQSLLDLARRESGCVSLQVDKLNSAQNLYRRLEFVQACDLGHAWLMRRSFRDTFQTSRVA